MATAVGEKPDRAPRTADGNAAFRHCRRLTRQARTEGHTALLVPSAGAQGETNLIIYFDAVAPKLVQIDDGPDRERIPAP